MTQPWESGEDYACPHCGATYAVTLTQSLSIDDDGKPCTECGDALAWWRSTTVPHFKLKLHKNGDPA